MMIHPTGRCKRLLIVLLLACPVCCYADGMSGVGEAMADAAMLVLLVTLVFNIAALALVSSKRYRLKRAILVLGITMNIAVGGLCLYTLPEQLADVKKNQYTTDIPEIAANRDKELAHIRSGIFWTCLMLTAGIGLSGCYVYVLARKREA